MRLDSCINSDFAPCFTGSEASRLLEAVVHPLPNRPSATPGPVDARGCVSRPVRVRRAWPAVDVSMMVRACHVTTPRARTARPERSPRDRAGAASPTAFGGRAAHDGSRRRASSDRGSNGEGLGVETARPRDRGPVSCGRPRRGARTVEAPRSGEPQSPAAALRTGRDAHSQRVRDEGRPSFVDETSRSRTPERSGREMGDPAALSGPSDRPTRHRVQLVAPPAPQLVGRVLPQSPPDALPGGRAARHNRRG